MRFLSLFSGIEAASQAWVPLGWECAAVAEIDAFPRSVLQTRHPGVPNLGDVTKIDEWDIYNLGRLDLVVFGSPCQDLSLAGNRKGLAGERSGLFHDAVRIIRYAREHCGCRFALWENVPGAFTSNEGRDFAVVVGALAGCTVELPEGKAWGNEGACVGEEGMVEWGTLDAQWFGVPQRRRRVFALADFGDWTRRPPVLLEPESMRGHPPARRGQGQGVAGTLTRGLGERGAEDGERGLLHVADSGSGNKAPIIAFGGNNTAGPIDVAAAVNAKGGAGRMDFETETLLMGFYPSDLTPANCVFKDASPTLKTASIAGVGGSFGVRRFTPRECERLQGMADDYTQVDHRGKPAADGPRYKALGNSMAVPVMNWIGRSLQSACWDVWA